MQGIFLLCRNDFKFDMKASAQVKRFLFFLRYVSNIFLCLLRLESSILF